MSVHLCVDAVGRRRYALTLLWTFLVFAAVLGVAPLKRADWLLENALVLLILTVLVLTYRKFPFSRISYTLIFVFSCLHEVGSHYTYSLVPYDAWCEALAGFSPGEDWGWQRNHFDRVVHFFYGLLIAYPIREIFLRIADVRGFWGYFLPLDLTMSSSLVYEFIEWGASGVFGGELGMDYLGTQGDVWDAHKDVALAALGAILAMAIAATINFRLQRDFAREWIESLRVKHPLPLGEEGIGWGQRDGDRDGDRDGQAGGQPEAD